MDKRAASKSEPIELSKPSVHFKYRSEKYFKNSDSPIGDWVSSLRFMALQTAPQSVRIFDRKTKLWADLFSSLNLTKKKIASLGPYPAELSPFLSSQKPLSRDPEDFNAEAIENLDAIFIFQPSLFDGFYYPQNILDSMVEKIRILNPKIKIICDESQSTFSFNEVTPGSLKERSLQDQNIYRVFGLFPCLAPQGPDICFWHGQNTLANELSDNSFSRDDIQVGLSILTLLRSRNDRFISEIADRWIILQRALRNFTDLLGRTLHEGLISIPYWPDAGFYISINISKILKEGQNDSDWIKEFFEKSEYKLIPGTNQGMPGHVTLCFARPLRALDILAKSMLGAIEESLAK